jgi:hypothetical protein
MKRPILKKLNQKKECVCPKCGYKEDFTRGVPCTEKKCPNCDTALKGKNCL